MTSRVTASRVPLPVESWPVMLVIVCLNLAAECKTFYINIDYIYISIYIYGPVFSLLSTLTLSKFLRPRCNHLVVVGCFGACCAMQQDITYDPGKKQLHVI